MKLVGKKLYRTGPLKLFKVRSGPGYQDPGQGNRASAGFSQGNRGGGGGKVGGNTGQRLSDPFGEKERRRKAEEAARKKEAEEKVERLKTEKTFTTKLEGAGKQAEARKMGQEAIGRIRSGEAGRVSREAALAGLVGASNRGGPGAKRMLQQQASGISRKAATEALAASKDVAGMAGKMRISDIGLSKADKTARMKHQQLILGEKLAREGMKAQVDAAKAGATGGGGGKASGGEILKRYTKGGTYPKKNGKIEGPGTETSDSIKARLSDGEFVVNAATVKGLGKLIGGKSKEDQRAKGSSLLYKLQAKYGKESDKERNLAVGGSAISGADMAKWAGQLAGTGILGKGAQTAGKAVSAGIAGKEAADEAAKTKVTKKQGETDKKLQREYWQSQISKGKPSSAPAGQEDAPKVMGMPKRLDEKKLFAKDGGDVKLGKGVKAKKKFLEAVGYEPSKHFEKKALKDYKEGHTGYKNYKGEKSSVPGYFVGASVAVPAAISIAGSLFGASSAAKQRKAQAQQQKSLAEQEAGKSLSKAGESIMKADASLKGGGSVIDRPKLNVEKLLKEPLGKEYRLPEHGDDIDSPSKKKLEPRSTKKPPLWMRKKEKPVKMDRGGSPLDALKKTQRAKRSLKDKILSQKKSKETIKKRKEIAEAKKRMGEREKPKYTSKFALLKKLEERKKDPDYKQIMKAERKGKSQEVYEQAVKKNKAAVAAKEKAGKAEWQKEMMEKLHEKEKPEFLKVAKEKLLKKQKDMASDPDYKQIREAQRKGKRLQKYEDAVKKAKAAVAAKEKAGKAEWQIGKKEEMKEAKSRIHESEKPRPGSREFLQTQKRKKHLELQERKKDPDYKQIMKAERKGKSQEVYEQAVEKAKKAAAAKEKAGMAEWQIGKREKQAAGEHDVRQASKRKDYKRQQEIKAHAAKVAAEAAAREKKDLSGDASYAEDVFKRSKAKKEAAKKVVAPGVKTKDDPGVKKKKPEGMTDKDWANMGIAGATSLLGSIAKSKKDKADRKRARAAEVRAAKGAAGRSLSSFGSSVMGMDTRLKGGGKVSFKDVLKAKKKMGY